jgi:thiol-disulfide isomerase/thioredoxin
MERNLVCAVIRIDPRNPNDFPGRCLSGLTVRPEQKEKTASTMRTPTKARIALFAAAALIFSGLISAQQAEKKPPEKKQPTVLVVYADWCAMCQKLTPVLSAIADKYRGKIRFVRYDITSRSTEAESKDQVQLLGLDEFFAKNREATSLVVILNAAGHEEFRGRGDYEPKHYEAVLDRLLQTESKVSTGFSQ